MPFSYRIGLQIAVVLFLLEGCIDAIQSCWWDLSFRNHILVFTTYKDTIFSYWSNDFFQGFFWTSCTHVANKQLKGHTLLKNSFTNFLWVNLIYRRCFEPESKTEHPVQDRLLKRESDIKSFKKEDFFLSVKWKTLFHV